MSTITNAVRKSLDVVLRGVECCTQAAAYKCKTCPYREMDNCTYLLGQDVVRFLKPQLEMPRPKIDSRTWEHCGKCDEILFRSYTFCPNCGRRIDWID